MWNLIDDADYYVGDNYNDDRNPDRCKHPPPTPVNYANQFQDDKDHGEYVTKTTDYLPLLAEYEIFGTRSYANSAEKNYQAQYAYYSAGNSKVKYRHSATGSTAWWWERSPYYSGSDYFCIVNTNGDAGYYTARNSIGVAPAFRV